VVYEWGWSEGGTVLLDRKRLPDEAFPHLDGHSPGDTIVVYPPRRERAAETALPDADFAQLDRVQPGRSLRVTSGAVCAHLGIHAAMTRVPYEIDLGPALGDGRSAS